MPPLALEIIRVYALNEALKKEEESNGEARLKS
jgi:hypothetical protein